MVIGAAERRADLPRAYSIENLSSPTGVVSARINSAKLLLTPKFREQPLFAAALPQRSTKLVAGSPAGIEPTVGVSLILQKTSLRLALSATEIVLSASAERSTGVG